MPLWVSESEPTPSVDVRLDPGRRTRCPRHRGRGTRSACCKGCSPLTNNQRQERRARGSICFPRADRTICGRAARSALLAYLAIFGGASYTRVVEGVARPWADPWVGKSGQPPRLPYHHEKSYVYMSRQQNGLEHGAIHVKQQQFIIQNSTK